MNLFLIRPRNVSHLGGTNTPLSCGYFDKIYLSESNLSVCENDLKNSLGVKKVTSIDGVPLHLQHKQKNELLFFDTRKKTYNSEYYYPFSYTPEFEEYLDKFLEEFKRLLKLKFKEKFAISKVKKTHSDKMKNDPFKMIFWESYSTCIKDFPEIENSRKMNSYYFFNNTFEVVDKMVRYIKSCIFSPNYTFDLDKFIDVDLFDNKKGSIWLLLSDKCLKIKKPLLEEYCGNNIVKVTKKKDNLFYTKKCIKIIKVEPLTILGFLKKNIPSWENVEKVREKNKITVLIYVPTFKDCFAVENCFNPKQFEYNYNKLKLKDKKITFSYIEKKLTITGSINNEKSIENVKFLFVEPGLNIFYKF